MLEQDVRTLCGGCEGLGGPRAQLPKAERLLDHCHDVPAVAAQRIHEIFSLNSERIGELLAHKHGRGEAICMNHDGSWISAGREPTAVAISPGDKILVSQQRVDGEVQTDFIRFRSLDAAALAFARRLAAEDHGLISLEEAGMRERKVPLLFVSADRFLAVCPGTFSAEDVSILLTDSPVGRKAR